MKKYEKKPLTIRDKIDLLKSRGMIIEDNDFAEKTLKHINYYRLSAYWKIFEKTDSSEHNFRENTKIEMAVNLYNFDKKLRLMILEAIELFEVSLRTVWSYTLSITSTDSHAYLNEKIFNNLHKYNESLKKIEKEYDNSKTREEYLIHYSKNYDSPKLPPIWSICESFTFGTLIHLYSNLKTPLKRQISKEYGLEEEVFISCLNNIKRVRDICAHHGRLWNRKLTTCIIKTPKKPKVLNSNFVQAEKEKSKIFNTVLILNYFIKKINPSIKWIEDLYLYLNNSVKNKIINTSYLNMMGIKSLSDFNKIINTEF